MASHQEVVRGLNVEKYMGRWYEIASFPSFFQPKGGVDTRATYTLRPDGNISVLNEVWVNGRRKSISGTAYKADPRSDEAKLKVRFRIPPDLPFVPVVGDYWVLYVDDGYQNAVVGHPTRRFLWRVVHTCMHGINVKTGAA
ncbi:temperature-induced lipocalin-1-like [Coffea arabica]|uniref:Temperature-induced lipocalin-1-like n=1 Tax=Coffea arabica TaxID=13443 RepID=A0ABM4UQL3_COFAR